MLSAFMIAQIAAPTIDCRYPSESCPFFILQKDSRSFHLPIFVSYSVRSWLRQVEKLQVTRSVDKCNV